MRRFIADIYKMLYKLTKKKLLSFSLALAYITTLNLILVYGLSFLLNGLVPGIKFVKIIFHRPYVFAVIPAALLIHFCLMLPLENLSKEKGKPNAVAPILIYSLAVGLLYAYIRSN